MNTREQLQRKAVEAFLRTDKRSIINACPRFGKIKVALDIIREMDVNHIWIIAPRKDIFIGWEADMKKFGFTPRVIGFSTFAGIKKIDTTLKPKLIILDEPHELSRNQQTDLARVSKGIPILGLTGTMTQKTRNELYDSLTLDVCFSYDIEDGVSDGILADYDIHIHKTGLDNTRKVHQTKKKWYTEKEYFNVFKYLRENSSDKFIMDLKMINIIQNSLAKLGETRRLIKYSDDRVLVFCGTTQIADSLFIPVYHSKSKEKEVLQNFCTGSGGVDKLATIKMMQAGITIKPIHRGIINYMSGNPEDSAQKICRFLGFEYDNPKKKAEIHIVTTTEEFELTRLKTGLAFFNPHKIHNL